jgi:hypothetical protein
MLGAEFMGTVESSTGGAIAAPAKAECVQNFAEFRFQRCGPSNKINASLRKIYMQILGLCLLVQLFLVFGVAGLFWPEKFMSLFGVLMFPWQANDRIIRANGMLAIAVYLVIVATLIVRAL